MLNRREAFGGLMVVAAVGLTPAYAVAQGWAPVALTPTQAATLEAAAEAIMPATDTPGAKDAGVARTIDGWVGGYSDKTEAAAIRAALDRIDAEARAGGGASFAALGAAQQAAVLAKIDGEAAPATGRAPFAVLKQYVTVAFFTSQPGATKTLRYVAVPGAYHGCIPVSQVGRAWATS